MRGEFKFETRTPGRMAVEYARVLGVVLGEARPRQLDVSEHRVFVRGGFFRFVSNWNLLVCVRSATIDAIPGDNQVTVRYEIKMTELLVLSVLATFIVVPVMLVDRTWFAPIVGSAMVWVWLFGMNYLITRLRMTSAFRHVARKVREAEASTPASVSAG